MELTPDDVGDVSELPGLLDQIDGEIASLTADGAYDGEVVHDAVANRHPDAQIIVLPRATAVSNETTTTQRDRHIATIEKHGRMGWQRRSGYNRRSLLRLRHIDTRPSLAVDFRPGFCPSSGSRRRLGATCSIG